MTKNKKGHEEIMANYTWLTLFSLIAYEVSRRARIERVSYPFGIRPKKVGPPFPFGIQHYLIFNLLYLV